MRIRVIKPLNTRIGGPSRTFQKGITRVPGEEMEVASIVKGEEIETNDDWYMQDKVDGNYYWSGGVNRITTAIGQPLSANDLSAKVILRKPIQESGRGVTIAILDTAIDLRYSFINQACISVDNFLSTPSNGSLNTHGTKVAGVLVANNNAIVGLAIDAKLKSYITNDNEGNTDDQAVLNALNALTMVNADIINLSLSVTTVLIDEIKNSINVLLNQGVIVVVAGHDALLGGPSNLSNIQGVFPIGIIEENNFLNAKQNGLDSRYAVSFLNQRFTSLGLFDSPTTDSSFVSSSAYTAVTTGIIARFLSSKNIPRNSRISEVTSFLSDTSFKISGETTISFLKPYK